MKRPEHVIWTRFSQTDQPVAVGLKAGPWGLPKYLRGFKRPFLGENGPFWGPQEFLRGL